LQIVTSAIENPNVVATCAGSELMKNMLPHLLEQLELCQKSLSTYLESKRAEFPRCRGRNCLCLPNTPACISNRWLV
jgi:dynein heavy chain